MPEALLQLDTELFRWVNGHHCTVADWMMWTFSQHWWWAAVLALFFVAVSLRTEPRRWWLVLAAGALCFLLADQSSVLVKETVCRLRPCHALDDVVMFRTRCGKPYGFVSSHAANAFALLTMLWLRYRRRVLPVALMGLWALTTCYSRVYLGKHYPADVLGGALLGVTVGVVVQVVMGFVEKKIEKK